MNKPNTKTQKEIEQLFKKFSKKPDCTEDNPCSCHFGETLHMDGICLCLITKLLSSYTEQVAKQKDEEFMGMIGEDENLYSKEREAGNWDWRVQREEGRNELRAKLRNKLQGGKE